MLLLIDIGNTATTIGLYDGAEISDTLELGTAAEGWNTGEYPGVINDFIRKHGTGGPAGAAICSVAPGITQLAAGSIKKAWGIEPLNVDHKIKTGLEFRIKNIEGLGADRISNAAAARKLYKGDLVVADFGTATTFCAITEKGEYKGGAIMPGLGISAACLAEKTAQLPLVELRPPVSVPGCDTESNILAGIIFGHAGAVERIINEIKKEICHDLSVIATGGLAGLVTPYIKMIDYINPLLTLEGLRIIYEINTETKAIK